MSSHGGRVATAKTEANGHLYAGRRTAARAYKRSWREFSLSASKNRREHTVTRTLPAPSFDRTTFSAIPRIDSKSGSVARCATTAIATTTKATSRQVRVERTRVSLTLDLEFVINISHRNQWTLLTFSSAAQIKQMRAGLTGK